MKTGRPARCRGEQLLGDVAVHSFVPDDAQHQQKHSDWNQRQGQIKQRSISGSRGDYLPKQLGTYRRIYVETQILEPHIASKGRCSESGCDCKPDKRQHTANERDDLILCD